MNKGVTRLLRQIKLRQGLGPKGENGKRRDWRKSRI